MNQLYRISLTEAGLTKGFIYSLGVPMPQCDYQPYSVTVPQSLGGNKTQGYKTVALQFLGVTPTQMYHVTTMVENAITNGNQLFLTIPRSDSVNGGPDWVDVSGYAQYPEITRDSAVSYLIYTSYILRVNNLTIINDPSTAVPT